MGGQAFAPPIFSQSREKYKSEKVASGDTIEGTDGTIVVSCYT
jgi:hypothetical protein